MLQILTVTLLSLTFVTSAIQSHPRPGSQRTTRTTPSLRAPKQTPTSARPTSLPTPFPTPTIDPASYVPRMESGPTITVSLNRAVISDGAKGGKPPSAITDSTQRRSVARQRAVGSQDLGVLINAADEELTRLGGGRISIEGGGSIKSQ